MLFGPAAVCNEKISTGEPDAGNQRIRLNNRGWGDTVPNIDFRLSHFFQFLQLRGNIV